VFVCHATRRITAISHLLNGARVNASHQPPSAYFGAVRKNAIFGGQPEIIVLWTVKGALSFYRKKVKFSLTGGVFLNFALERNKNTIGFCVAIQFG
jgi:hypothetical protein